MKKKNLCVLLCLLVCSFAFSIDLDHFGRRGATKDGSFCISLYDKNEKNGIVFMLSPSSFGSEQFLTKLIVLDNSDFSILYPEGLILDSTNEYAIFIVSLLDCMKNKVAFAECKADYVAGIDTIILKHDYDGSETLVDTIMNSLLIDKKLKLAVSAIDISNQELVVGTTRVFDYDVTIDSVELEDAHLDYCIWLYLMSGWQI